MFFDTSKILLLNYNGLTELKKLKHKRAVDITCFFFMLMMFLFDNEQYTVNN